MGDDEPIVPEWPVTAHTQIWLGHWLSGGATVYCDSNVIAELSAYPCRDISQGAEAWTFGVQRTVELDLRP